MPSIVKPIPLEGLSKLDTKQLLGLRDRLLACEESLADSDVEDVQREVDPSTIRFKDDPRWEELYQAVKAVLAGREHVLGGDERRAKRQQQVKMQKTSERRRKR